MHDTIPPHGLVFALGAVFSLGTLLFGRGLVPWEVLLGFPTVVFLFFWLIRSTPPSEIPELSTSLWSGYVVTGIAEMRIRGIVSFHG